MDAIEVSLVKDSWTKVVPIAATAADIFYGKLFEKDPSLRPLFAEDMTEQKKKLMQMIGRVVSALDKLETVVPAVQELGRRHTGYGVQPAHYAVVGEALLETLEAGLGEAFTEEVEAAWATAYQILATTMIEAAARAA